MSDASNKSKKLYSFLIAAGIFPFIFTAIAPLFAFETLNYIGSIQRAGALYGLIIVSFMSGVHWGICIANDCTLNSSQTKILMLGSNIYVLIPWLCYLFFGHNRVFYLSLIAAFSLIFISDRVLYFQNVINEHYYRTRRLVTIAVLLCLLLNALNQLNV